MLRLKTARVGTLLPPPPLLVKIAAQIDSITEEQWGQPRKRTIPSLSPGRKVNERDGQEQGSLSPLICSNRVTCAQSH